MTEVETRVIEQTVRIAAEPQVVWRYWIDPERMADWWGDTAELDPRPGGVCRVAMEEGPVMVGEYVELVLYERLVFTFGWEGNAPDQVGPGSTRVEITLEEDGDDTVLTLRHTDLPAAQAGDHEKGWAHFLGVLVERAGATGGA